MQQIKRCGLIVMMYNGEICDDACVYGVIITWSSSFVALHFVSLENAAKPHNPHNPSAVVVCKLL